MTFKVRPPSSAIPLSARFLAPHHPTILQRIDRSIPILNSYGSQWLPLSLLLKACFAAAWSATLPLLLVSECPLDTSGGTATTSPASASVTTSTPNSRTPALKARHKRPSIEVEELQCTSGTS
ncbi:hypothetical protein VTN49DRAFT_2576 [Thermomyces lanuginosus]|uniref:uncharacterized protein n=1 Tax=Thermomyces lanuginosus TaxID=5541 RepID=UPI0037424318